LNVVAWVEGNPIMNIDPSGEVIGATAVAVGLTMVGVGLAIIWATGPCGPLRSHADCREAADNISKAIGSVKDICIDAFQEVGYVIRDLLNPDPFPRNPPFIPDLQLPFPDTLLEPLLRLPFPRTPPLPAPVGPLVPPVIDILDVLGTPADQPSYTSIFMSRRVIGNGNFDELVGSLQEQGVQRVAPLFGSRFPHRSIYLYPNIGDLPIGGLFVGSGIVDFQPSQSGNQ